MPLAAILPAAIGLGANVAGGIYNAATAPARKRQFIRAQKKQALYELLSRRAAELGAPTYAVDAMAKNQQIHNTANQNFRTDPTQFLGTVGSGAQLAGAIYDDVNEPSAPQAADPFQQPDVLTEQDYQEPNPVRGAYDSPLRRGRQMNLFGR